MSLFNELKRRNVFRVGIAYTVAAWLLIQVTDIVFPRIWLPDSAVTLVIALLAIGFIPALIFAWAFEMTPDGIKREKDVDRTRSITPKTGRKLDRMIIVILAAVVGWFLIDEYYFEPLETKVSTAAAVPVNNETPESPDTANSIAVLPFVNMSADAENEYFSDGISEELLNVLVKISTLNVASRTSAFAYKGKDLPISQIASELKVDHVLEGSVRKAGNRVRITAQLINAKSDRHIWSETYERELVDIFDIQEEISKNIVDALKVALNVDESAAIGRAQRPTENAEAYELYLQGRFAWRQRHEVNIRKSIELFEKAITLDPDFARAHEALAVSWAVLPVWAGISNAEATQNSKPHAIRALELDPTLSEARAVLAETIFDEHRWLDGIAEYNKAISNDPRNPTLHQWLGEAFIFLGFLSKGLEEMRIAYELDPASPVINQSMAWIATLNKDDQLAFRHIEISKGLGVGDRAIFGSIDTFMRSGNWVATLASMGPDTGFPEVAHTCFAARHDPSLTEQLRTQLDQFIQTIGDATPPEELSLCMSMAGEPERAAEMVLIEIEDRWNNIRVFWRSREDAGAMRQTHTFRKALADLKLLNFYHEYGWPDLCHPVGEVDFECDE